MTTYNEEQYNDILRTSAANTQALTVEIASLKASLAEHQQLAAEAEIKATVEIQKLAQAGADVSALVAIVTDVAAPIRQRAINAKIAEVAAAESALADKKAALASLQNQ